MLRAPLWPLPSKVYHYVLLPSCFVQQLAFFAFQRSSQRHPSDCRDEAFLVLESWTEQHHLCRSQLQLLVTALNELEHYELSSLVSSPAVYWSCWHLKSLLPLPELSASGQNSQHVRLQLSVS